MPRRTATTALLAVLLLGSGVALLGCTAPSPPPEGAEEVEVVETGDVLAEETCLTEHSPWSLDTEAAAAEWRGSIPSEFPVTSAELQGSALLTFLPGTRSGGFTTSRTIWQVELSASDGSVLQVTHATHELEFDFAVPTGEAVSLTDVHLSVDEMDTLSTLPGGATTPTAVVPVPRFPWTTVSGGVFEFQCSAESLTVLTPGGIPASWSFTPGA